MKHSTKGLIETLENLKRQNTVLPVHIPPQLHPNAPIISFENARAIEKIYKDILGIDCIDHFSLNIVDPCGNMSVISLNPSIIFQLVYDGTYLFNGSISPSFYKFKKQYSWDETYDIRYENILKNKMELKNGIKKGIVLTKKVNGFYLLYSFATKSCEHHFTEVLNEKIKFFYTMGDHCYSGVNTIIQNYIEDYQVPNLNEVIECEAK